MRERERESKGITIKQVRMNKIKRTQSSRGSDHEEVFQILFSERT